MIYFLILSILLNAVLAFSIFKLFKRLIEAENSMNDVSSNIDSLAEFCESLKKKSLAYHSPEVVAFHKLVVQVSNSFSKEKEAKTNG
jgi:hypothetical protein